MPRVVQAVGPSHPLPDRKSGVQRAVNLYLSEVEGQGEDTAVILESAPGLSLLVDTGATIRGSHCAGGRWFVVAGSTLYEVIDSTLTALGALGTSTGYVSMDDGTSQLVMVDGPGGYVLNLESNVFGQITSPAWRGSDWVVAVDGYFVFVDPNTDQFYLSAIDDATTLDALDFTSADTQPDDIVTHRVHKRDLILFGELSTEVWQDSGDADFPFIRLNSVPIDVGVVGQRAAIHAADTLFFVGQTKKSRGLVYVMDGRQPVRVSTRAQEEALQAPGVDLSLCSMWAYGSPGHEFIGINAPGMPTTWVFDAATKEWHERCDLVNGEFTAHRIDHVTMVDGVQYAAAGSKLLQLDSAAYTLDGDPLVRERTWPHLVSPEFEPVAYSLVELACTTGYGGNVTLECSNDGGYVFLPPLARSLGATGRRQQRLRWPYLGSAVDRVFRIRCSDAVPFTIRAAVVNPSS